MSETTAPISDEIQKKSKKAKSRSRQTKFADEELDSKSFSEQLEFVKQPLASAQALVTDNSETTLGDVMKKLFKPLTWFKKTLLRSWTKDCNLNEITDENERNLSSIKLFPVLATISFLLCSVNHYAFLPYLLVAILGSSAICFLTDQKDNYELSPNGFTFFCMLNSLYACFLGLFFAGMVFNYNYPSPVITFFASPVLELTPAQLINHDFNIRFTNQESDMLMVADGTAHIKHEWIETKNPDGMRVKTEVPDSTTKWKFVGDKLHIEGVGDMRIGPRDGHIFSGSGQVIGDVRSVSNAPQDAIQILKSINALKISDGMKMALPTYSMGSEASQYVADQAQKQAGDLAMYLYSSESSLEPRTQKDLRQPIVSGETTHVEKPVDQQYQESVKLLSMPKSP